MEEEEFKNLCNQFVEAKKRFFEYLNQFVTIGGEGKNLTLEEIKKLSALREEWQQKEKEWWRQIRGE